MQPMNLLVPEAVLGDGVSRGRPFPQPANCLGIVIELAIPSGRNREQRHAIDSARREPVANLARCLERRRLDVVQGDCYRSRLVHRQSVIVGGATYAVGLAFPT
jgi:hypothetical protein